VTVISFALRSTHRVCDGEKRVPRRLKISIDLLQLPRINTRGDYAHNADNYT